VPHLAADAAASPGGLGDIAGEHFVLFIWKGRFGRHSAASEGARKKKEEVKQNEASEQIDGDPLSL
jgi:hypothetical protein